MIDPERIAKLFHEAYERLAPQYGYETRPESAVPWDEVPDNNKRLMTAVCWEVFSGVCREVDELRRDKESYRQTANSTAARVADLEVQRDELRRENEWLKETYYPKPLWLPAPDSKPLELADAQMVEVRVSAGDCRWRHRAKVIAWPSWKEYRPLYSDSGLPLCSPDGLHEDTKYVATDNDGCVFQYRTKPHLPEDRLYWWLSDSFIGRAPSSHRRPGPWYDSLMEVMR